MHRSHRWRTIASAAAALALTTTLGAGAAQAAQSPSGRDATVQASSALSARDAAEVSAAKAAAAIPQDVPFTLAATNANSCATVRTELPAFAKAGRTRIGCLTPLPAAARSSSTAGAALARPGTIPLPSGCEEEEWEFNRTLMCGEFEDEYEEIDPDTGELVGTADFQVNQLLTLSATSPEFNETYEFLVTGATPGLLETGNLSVTCSVKTTCQDFGGFEDMPLVTGEDEVVTLAGSDTTTSIDSNAISYSLTWGPETIEPVTYTGPTFRCDNGVAVSGSAGCIVPAYTPSVDMSPPPTITQNILAVWAKSTMEYGNPALGHPLTRNTALESANRAVACPPSVVAAAPSGTSCDEYPFARSAQGASQVPASEWGWMYVPDAEQDSQGGIGGSFVKNNRIMNATNSTPGDAYWVIP
jgi:hypothetical protein